MIRGLPTTVLSAVLAGVVGVGLFFIKHEVKEQEARLSELNQDVLRNQEVIHVLKAEWSYLNDPARLRALSEKYLSMKVMRSTQIATLNSMPVNGTVMAKAEVAKPAAAEAIKVAAAEAIKVAAAEAIKVAAAPAPQPPKPVVSQPGKPVFVAQPVKAAQAPALQAPPTAPGRTIVIQSPALASTPALPGEVR